MESYDLYFSYIFHFLGGLVEFANNLLSIFRAQLWAKQKIRLLFIHPAFVTKNVVAIKGLVKSSNCHCFVASDINKWKRVSCSCCDSAPV